MPEILATMTVKEAAEYLAETNRTDLRRWGETFGIPLKEFHTGHIRTYQIDRAQEVPGIGVAVIEFDHMLEILHCRLRIAAVLVQHAEGVPGMGIFRVDFDRFVKDCFCGVNFRQTQQCDCLIDFRDAKAGIGGSGFLKILQPFLEQLLIHVSATEIVQAGSISKFSLFFGACSEEDQSGG